MLPAHHAIITSLCKEGKVHSLILKNKLKNTRRGKSSGALSLTVATIDHGGNRGKHVNSNTNCRTNMLTATPIVGLTSVQSLMHIHIHVKTLLFLWDFRHNWNNLTKFSKNLKYQFSRISAGGSQKMFHSDTRRDLNLIFSFRGCLQK